MVLSSRSDLTDHRKINEELSDFRLAVVLNLIVNKKMAMLNSPDPLR